MSNKPLCVDLFCGLGGWSSGFLAEGYACIGFDIERHDYGTGGYPGQLVLQDVLTLHGSQFKDAAVIVASPPCQFFSYCAMPWTRAKLLGAVTKLCPVRLERELALFNACFRIAKEAGVPLIIENVRGAQPWVGPAKWNFGSFYLWGDVPALMPSARRLAKVPGLNWSGSDKPGYKAEAFNTTVEQRLRRTSEIPDLSERIPVLACADTEAEQALLLSNVSGSNKSLGMDRGMKNSGGSSFNVAHNTVTGNNPVSVPGGYALKGYNGGWFNDNKRNGTSTETGYLSRSGSKSDSRKAASAQIAKIPRPLSQYIARVFYPC